MAEISPSLLASVLLNKHGFRTAHSLGQNFLLDDYLLLELIDLSGVGADDVVLEVGPGPGTMTRLIAQRVKSVTAVEIDRRLEPVLSEMLAGQKNARVVYADALKANLSDWMEEPFHVVANLPYYITSDLILKLITSGLPVKSLSVMVQREAAERMTSSPGDKNWCQLAAIVQYFGTPAVLAEIPPEAFDPSPHVTSAFLKIALHEDKPVKPKDEALFLRVVASAFAMRRKTLANNLKAYFGLPSEVAKDVVLKIGEDERVRGEALSLHKLALVSDVVLEAVKNS